MAPPLPLPSVGTYVQPAVGGPNFVQIPPALGLSPALDALGTV